MILTTREQVEAWLVAPAEELTLQRPLPDGCAALVASGEKEDKAIAA